MLSLRLIKQLGHTTQAEQITLSAEACDDPISPFGDKRVVAEFLALVHVGNVHLDYCPIKRVQSIQDSDRGMGESRGVHHDTGSRLARLMDPIDDLVFSVGLMKANLQAEL